MPMTALDEPGIISDITSYSNEGGFVDGDKVRFRFGFQKSLVVGRNIAPTSI